MVFCKQKIKKILKVEFLHGYEDTHVVSDHQNNLPIGDPVQKLKLLSF